MKNPAEDQVAAREAERWLRDASRATDDSSLRVERALKRAGMSSGARASTGIELREHRDAERLLRKIQRESAARARAQADELARMAAELAGLQVTVAELQAQITHITARLPPGAPGPHSSPVDARAEDALLESLENPHAESLAFAELGLADWAAALPAEPEGWFDPHAGQAVRWDTQRGWTLEGK